MDFTMATAESLRETPHVFLRGSLIMVKKCTTSAYNIWMVGLKVVYTLQTLME